MAALVTKLAGLIGAGSRRPGTCARGPGWFGILFFFVFAVVGTAVVVAAVKKFDPVTHGFFASRDFLGMAGIGAVFAVVGYGGVYFSWRSMRQMPQRNVAFSDVWIENPCFPKAAKKRFARSGMIRLEPEAGAGTKFVGLTMLALFWNGITGGALYSMLSEDNIPWIPMALLSIFVLVGVVLIFAAVHALLRVLLVGDTSVEISREPLAPGETATIYVKQAGRFTVERAEVRLFCREQVTYRRGTDRVTEKEEVHSEVVAESHRLQARSGHSLLDAQLRIPEDAMHSFEAANNKIRWFIGVKLVIAGRPDVDDAFVLRVSPQRIG
jgi:hypothetical protein